SLDAREAVQESYFPTILACLGVGFVIGSCPLALLGLAWWIAESTTLSVWAASLIVAGGGLIFAIGLLFFAWRGYRSSLALLGRSRSEFRSNLQWIKNLLSKKHRRRWPF
ncbi:MAG: phage holin family protein, partial [Planctomycetaceae bacterium]|nr:phage holin family protein [Planctomycetaceae bacterium]